MRNSRELRYASAAGERGQGLGFYGLEFTQVLRVSEGRGWRGWVLELCIFRRGERNGKCGGPGKPETVELGRVCGVWCMVCRRELGGV